MADGDFTATPNPAKEAERQDKADDKSRDNMFRSMELVMKYRPEGEDIAVTLKNGRAIDKATWKYQQSDAVDSMVNAVLQPELPVESGNE